VGVEYADGQLAEWPARIVATDAAHDLAVLRIDAPPEKLRPIQVQWHHVARHPCICPPPVSFRVM
jgi:S1-C subfamily serine protease